MPSLSVRAFAEMLDKPAYELVRILNEQKYPSKEPQVFKLPYYKQSLSAIRNFYKNNNDFCVIDDAVKNIGLTTKPDSKAKHNIRVIQSFAKSKISERKLNIKTCPKLKYSLDDVEIRLNFDLAAEEKKQLKMLFFNFRNVEITDKLAKRILELSHFILRENKFYLNQRNLELIDLSDGTVHQLVRPRRKTIELMKTNISIIKTLWPTI